MSCPYTVTMFGVAADVVLLPAAALCARSVRHGSLTSSRSRACMLVLFLRLLVPDTLEYWVFSFSSYNTRQRILSAIHFDFNLPSKDPCWVCPQITASCGSQFAALPRSSGSSSDFHRPGPYSCARASYVSVNYALFSSSTRFVSAFFPSSPGPYFSSAGSGQRTVHTETIPAS